MAPAAPTAIATAAPTAIVFVVPRETATSAYERARGAGRLPPPERTPAPAARPEIASSRWEHQALTPLPTEGFLALRAAASCERSARPLARPTNPSAIETMTAAQMSHAG